MGISSPRIKVGVLRGGPSNGYDHSLKTGARVLALLHEMGEDYEPVDIFISRDGEWHSGGLVVDPEQALRHVDVVWNALHGSFGEDGQIQRILESFGKPFVGSQAVPATLAHNKHLTKEVYKRLSFLTPDGEFITEDNLNEDLLVKVFRTYLHPVVVKPADGVHSVGVKKAYTYAELGEAIKETFKISSKVLVEEHIVGKEVSCGVVEGGRGEKLYTLVPTGDRSAEENQVISDITKQIHESLGLRHYSTSDFVITPKGKIYVLETNASPALHEESPMHHSLKATGWKSKDFVRHCLDTAIRKSVQNMA